MQTLEIQTALERQGETSLSVSGFVVANTPPEVEVCIRPKASNPSKYFQDTCRNLKMCRAGGSVHSSKELKRNCPLCSRAGERETEKERGRPISYLLINTLEIYTLRQGNTPEEKYCLTPNQSSSVQININFSFFMPLLPM